MEHYFKKSLPEKASVYKDIVPYLPNYHCSNAVDLHLGSAVLRDLEYFILNQRADFSWPESVRI
jgi:hypothetical protein